MAGAGKTRAEAGTGAWPEDFFNSEMKIFVMALKEFSSVEEYVESATKARNQMAIT